MSDVPDFHRAFSDEYERINRSLYSSSLPPFPGVELVDRTDVFSLTRGRHVDGRAHFAPFLVSRHLAGDLLLESIRHEVAHVAAIVIDGHFGHGPDWRRHATRVGASGEPTLPAGHPLRDTWPRTW